MTAERRPRFGRISWAFRVERASIIGNVTDVTGAAAPGVTVTVTNEGTNTSVMLTTDDVGA